jgi:hypothetical protein
VKVRFSQRHGHTEVKKVVQIDSIDEELRNSLWNVFLLCVWEKVHHETYYTSFAQSNPEFAAFCKKIWFNYFKSPLDTIPAGYGEIYESFRRVFFACKWFELYDFLEEIALYFPFNAPERFIVACNQVLTAEVSAYRFVGKTISKVTDETELCSIQTAIDASNKGVHTHLRRALELLSDRKSPDYRNSIKESISAVESLVASAVGEKGSLGNLMKKMQDEVALHPALEKAFSNLYGYTSDKDGIRHAIMERTTLDFDDAKFFLVVCSAFVNFVTGKVKK